MFEGLSMLLSAAVSFGGRYRGLEGNNDDGDVFMLRRGLEIKDDDDDDDGLPTLLPRAPD